MRIVLVIDQFDDSNNGTTITAQRYAASLRQRGHEVRVVAVGAPKKDKYPVRKRYIPIVSRVAKWQGMCFAKPDDAILQDAFEGADIVHFFVPFKLCRRGEEIARQMHIPTIAAFHMQPENVSYNIGLGRLNWVNACLYRYLYRHFYNRFEHIHCPSQFIADQLAAHHYDAQLHVISNGVADVFRPTPVPRPAWAQGKFVILMVGRLSPEKRQDLIIKAVKKSKYRDQIQLVFAGKGPKRRWYAFLGHSLPHPPRFVFCSQQELIALFSATDLYIHASDAEIEGISCMEAFSSGLVPVISDAPMSATHQYALDERSLFKAGSADSLAEKIDYWIEHPQQRAQMAPQYAALGDTLRVSACVQKAEAMYQQAIADFRDHGYPPRPRRGLLRLLTPNIAKSKGFTHNAAQHFGVGLFQKVISPLVGLWNYLFYGFHIHGREHLRQVRNGAVVICNHVHPMDCTMVPYAVFPHTVSFMAMRDNFRIPLIGYLIRALGAVPLPEHSSGMPAYFRSAVQQLEKGEWIVCFAEGVLYPYCKRLRPFHAGGFLMASMAQVPVVPIAITFRPRRGLFRLFGRKPLMELHILPPSTAPSQRRDYAQWKDDVHAQMAQCIEQANCRHDR